MCVSLYAVLKSESGFEGDRYPVAVPVIAQSGVAAGIVRWRLVIDMPVYGVVRIWYHVPFCAVVGMDWGYPVVGKVGCRQA